MKGDSSQEELKINPKSDVRVVMDRKKESM